LPTPVRRFQQFANAAAIGGYFTKVDNQVLSKPVLVHDDDGGQVCASLSAGGGECRTDISTFSFVVPLRQGFGVPVIQSRRVATLTQTRFDSGTGRAIGAAAKCEVYGPISLLNGTITITGNLIAEMRSSSAERGEPDIDILVPGFPDIIIGQATIKTTIDTSPFDDCKSKKSLKQQYARNPKFRAKFWRRFHASSPNVQEAPEFEEDLIGSIAQVTIENKPPDVTIEPDGYSITWPGIGRIIVGEVFVNKYYRRLTLLRFLFGSPFQGDLAMADVETDGHEYP
jgi:hypothetical protein